MVFLRRLLFVSLDNTELCRVLGVLHDVPVEGLYVSLIRLRDGNGPFDVSKGVSVAASFIYTC